MVKGVFAQVSAITNNPDLSAALDLSNPNKGLLIPRVNLSTTTDKSQIINSNPVQTLIVFNTNSSITGTGAGGTGYYYWDVNSWKKLASVPDLKDNAWTTSGNAGINPAIDFLGTTDNKDLVIKTNGTEKMRITANGNVGVGLANPGYNLEVAGTTKIEGNTFLGTAVIVPPAGVSSLVKDNTTGQVYAVVSTTGNTKPVSYIKFSLTNVNSTSVTNCDTKIDATQYTVLVTGASFSSSLQNDGLKMVSGYTGTFAPQNVYAFVSGGTWRLEASYKGGQLASGTNGNWDVYCLVINNSLVKPLSDQVYNTNSSYGSGTKPAGL